MNRPWGKPGAVSFFVYNIIVMSDDPDLLSAAEQILRDFPDEKLSYVDALSMAIMRKEKIGEIFTFDRHFRLMNFEVLPGL